MSVRVEELLAIRDLRKVFPPSRNLRPGGSKDGGRGIVALDGVSLGVDRREIIGLVGESGSGKTTLARCLVRLVEPDAGAVRFDGDDVVKASSAQLRVIRRRMQLIYQDPYSSLNPRLRVGDAIGEAARVHGFVRDASETSALVSELLDAVGLSRSDARRHPREMSGGQRQRVAIARSLAVRPDLLIADEAVSALDVSVQAQILNLFGALSNDRHLAIIFISHQLAVIAQLAHRVAVMYLGRIVEIGDTADVFANPQHPYTALLLAAHPTAESLGPRSAPVLQGEIPSPDAIPSGCRFRGRCDMAQDICAEVDPPAIDVGGGHLSWCHILPKMSSADMPVAPGKGAQTFGATEPESSA
jgi:peptide/nickel transport system ATP-binding protein